MKIDNLDFMLGEKYKLMNPTTEQSIDVIVTSIKYDGTAKIEFQPIEFPDEAIKLELKNEAINDILEQIIVKHKDVK